MVTSRVCLKGLCDLLIGSAKPFYLVSATGARALASSWLYQRSAYGYHTPSHGPRATPDWPSHAILTGSPCSETRTRPVLVAAG